MLHLVNRVPRVLARPGGTSNDRDAANAPLIIVKTAADELPTQIHQILCGTLSLLVFAAAWFFLSPGIAVLLAIVTCLAATFFAVPLTWWIYQRMRGDEARADTSIHTTDAGCAALIFLLLFFALLPVLLGAVKTRREYSHAVKPAPQNKR